VGASASLEKVGAAPTSKLSLNTTVGPDWAWSEVAASGKARSRVSSFGAGVMVEETREVFGAFRADRRANPRVVGLWGGGRVQKERDLFPDYIIIFAMKEEGGNFGVVLAYNYKLTAACKLDG